VCGCGGDAGGKASWVWEKRSVDLGVSQKRAKERACVEGVCACPDASLPCLACFALLC